MREIASEGTAYAALVERLSRRSVADGHDPYRGIDWDAPENHIDPEDPRWEAPTVNPLARTLWYRAESAGRRARLALEVVCSSMKVGWQFENVLERGLLGFVETLPDDAPERRFVHHEIAEESRHTQMFQEFVRRAGISVPGLTALHRRLGDGIAGLGRSFPELLFVFALGGECPIDHLQRLALATPDGLHPLLRQIMEIHVTEEARHVGFARAYLRERVPRLPTARRLLLAVAGPIILAHMAPLMLLPPAAILRRHGVPWEAMREMRESPANRQRMREAIAKIRQLYLELGLYRAVLWRALGLEPEASP
jgi:hypothetical protein